MTNSRGASLTGHVPRVTSAITRSLAVCFVFGVFDALIDIYVHVPLRTPGWRGLFIVALLVSARLVSGRSWGASATGLAAVFTTLFLAGPPPLTTMDILAPGLVIDAIGLVLPQWRTSALVASLAGGAANVAKLAVGILAVAVFSSHTSGIGLTPTMGSLTSYFLFGFFGGGVGALLFWSVTKLRKANT